MDRHQQSDKKETLQTPRTPTYIRPSSLHRKIAAMPISPSVPISIDSYSAHKFSTNRDDIASCWPSRKSGEGWGRGAGVTQKKWRLMKRVTLVDASPQRQKKDSLRM